MAAATATTTTDGTQQQDGSVCGCMVIQNASQILNSKKGWCTKLMQGSQEFADSQVKLRFRFPWDRLDRKTRRDKNNPHDKKNPYDKNNRHPKLEVNSS